MADAEPEDASRVHEVLDRLRRAADPSGFVPFDRFMDVALYADRVGFYALRRSPLGPKGDFYTAAHVSPLFGATVAERVRAVRRELPASEPFRIVELGPGDGTLAEGLVANLAAEPGLTEYVLIDRSSARATEAEERVRAVARGIRVRRSVSLGQDGPFAGAVIANEFLDAQPARRLRWDGRAWKELGVEIAAGRLRASERDVERPVPSPPLPTPSEEGTVLEVSPGAEGAVREIGDHLLAGLAILIDYGLEETELLRGHPSGTLAAVRHHRTVADPLADPGTTDLSTFVNFSRIRRVARDSGLRELAFRSQAEALGAWGFPRLLEGALAAAGSSEAQVRLRLAAKNLLFGFERFRVLELAPRAVR